MNINVVVLGGYLTRDPELKYMPSGAPVCTGSIATNRKYTNKAGETKEEVGFFKVKAFGKTAELLAQYFVKGSPIVVEGYLFQEVWEKEGNKKEKTGVQILSIHFPVPKGKGAAGSGEQGEEAGE